MKEKFLNPLLKEFLREVLSSELFQMTVIVLN